MKQFYLQNLKTREAASESICEHAARKNQVYYKGTEKRMHEFYQRKRCMFVAFSKTDISLKC